MKTAVVGNSMEPCLESSQEVVVDRLITVIKNPARGEVIAFLPKGNEKTHYYIKRVIGLPGETIQIKGGRVYIDGTLYDDPYGEDMIMDPGIAANEFVLILCAWRQPKLFRRFQIRKYRSGKKRRYLRKSVV